MDSRLKWSSENINNQELLHSPQKYEARNSKPICQKIFVQCFVMQVIYADLDV